MSASPQQQLILLLQRAHAGELAAAFAYDGHAKSVKSPVERREIENIRDEELHHRSRLGLMLASLGAGPAPARERRMGLIGRTIGFLCHLGGWFVPMFGAGWLERQNIVEYEDATRLALACDRDDLARELIEFAEVEWDHEQYFRAKSREHWLSVLVPIWSDPGLRSSYRAAFPTLALPPVAVATTAAAEPIR